MPFSSFIAFHAFSSANAAEEVSTITETTELFSAIERTVGDFDIFIIASRC
jgi:hypothetical protein